MRLWWHKSDEEVLEAWEDTGTPGSYQIIRSGRGYSAMCIRKNSSHCTLDISALYPICLLSFAPLCLLLSASQLKQKQKLLGRRYVTFGKREMTEMTLEVIIKRKHQERVSDFYPGHIHQKNSESKTFCKQKWEESGTFSTTLHWIALLYKEVILKST